MTKEMTIVDQREILGKNFRIYGDLENPKFLARDVAEWIDYDSSKVGQLLSTIDEDEKETSPIFYSGQVRNMWFLTEDGLYEVLMQSHKPNAKKFKKQVKIILKSIRKHGAYMTEDVIQKAIANPEFVRQLAMQIKQEKDQSMVLVESLSTKVESLEEKIDTMQQSLVFQPYIDPKARVTSYGTRFSIVVNQGKYPRNFYDAIQDYFGILVPRGDELPSNLKVYQYIIEKFDLDEVERFVCGVEQKLIVKSKAGHWVNRNGYNTNSVEWERTLRDFGYSCAYCGSTEGIVAEHIVPYGTISKFNPELTNVVNNVVPSCPICNQSKYTHDMEQWYKRQRSFDPARLRKIKEHQKKYEI